MTNKAPHKARHQTQRQKLHTHEMRKCVVTCEYLPKIAANASFSYSFVTAMQPCKTTQTRLHRSPTQRTHTESPTHPQTTINNWEWYCKGGGGHSAFAKLSQSSDVQRCSCLPESPANHNGKKQCGPTRTFCMFCVHMGAQERKPTITQRGHTKRSHTDCHHTKAAQQLHNIDTAHNAHANA